MAPAAISPSATFAVFGGGGGGRGKQLGKRFSCSSSNSLTITSSFGSTIGKKSGGIVELTETLALYKWLDKKIWQHFKMPTSGTHPTRLHSHAVSSEYAESCPSGSGSEVFDRRVVVLSSLGVLAAATWNFSLEGEAMASGFADMPAIRGKDYGKSKMRYPDYTETESGLQYKDLRVGSGPTPKMGETVVVDWDGYTIGYYGRIFEARNKTKGGSFEGDDKEFYKFRIGSQEVIPAFEEAVKSMALGGIRRIVVPPELGYPQNDYNTRGPRPTTFSGQRALDFVLRNQGLIDKTLLFDIELLKIISN